MANESFSCPQFPSWRVQQELQERLGYEFKKTAGLALALTHTSWANENDGAQNHNQRLEFLGDAVLELCVSDELYRRFPAAREGVLTEIRARLVSEPTLARLAIQLGLNKALRLGKGEEQQEGRKKDSLLADVFEAILAAVYKDGGLEAAAGVVSKMYEDLWDNVPRAGREKDPKSRLQEECQKRYKALPVYSLRNIEGPEHARIFTVRVLLPDGTEFSGTESSAKKAEQAAAASALASLI